MMLSPSRRARVLLPALFVTAALGLAGCSATSTADAGVGADSAEASSGGFPATVDTMFGEITVDEKPQRIIALGGEFVDALASLDEEAIAFVGSPRAGDDMLAGYPWLDDPRIDLDAHDLELTDHYTPALEAIAAYKPDLILGYPEDEEQYKQISLIAPTYAPPADTDWADWLEGVGILTGNADQAEKIVAEVEAELDSLADRLPGLQGASYINADFYDASAFSVADEPGGFLKQALGLVPDEQLVAAEELSVENLDQLTSDVAFFTVFRADLGGEGLGQSGLESDPRFAELPAVKNGTVVWVDAPVLNAEVEAGPLALRWWLETIVPQLEGSALNASGE